jgi:hypothetical protein
MALAEPRQPWHGFDFFRKPHLQDSDTAHWCAIPLLHLTTVEQRQAINFQLIL